MSNPSNKLNAWNQFWFQPTNVGSLGLVRLFFGLTLFWKCTGSYALVRLGSQPIRWQFPRPDVFDVQSLGTAFWVPWPGMQWLPALPQLWISRLVLALTILSVFVALGLFTRWVTLAAALITTYLFLLSQCNYHHHMVLFICVLWILALSPSGRRFSLDALAQTDSPNDGRMWILPIRLIQVLVCFIYLCSFISKLDVSWWNGSLLRLYHELGALRGPFVDFGMGITGYPVAGILATCAEGFLAFGLLWPKTRRMALLVGIGLHVSIDASMEVSTYGYQMLALYLAFIVPATGTTVVLYDGRCGMCRASRSWTKLLDWFGRITWLDFRLSQTREQVPYLQDEQLEKEMVAITADGRVFSGFKAWREILARLPLTFVPSFLCYLPPISMIGGRVYQFIAARRKLSCEVSFPSQQMTPAEQSLARAREKMAAR